MGRTRRSSVRVFGRTRAGETDDEFLERYMAELAHAGIVGDATAGSWPSYARRATAQGDRATAIGLMALDEGAIVAREYVK